MITAFVFALVFSLTEPPVILVTSFTTWDAKQSHNSSNLLTAELKRRDDPAIVCLRDVPVETEFAAAQIRNAIHTLRPRWVIITGMAASLKGALFLEKWACYNGDTRRTWTNIEDIAQSVEGTVIRYHAGNEVCEHVYHETLEFVEREYLRTMDVFFVHVPDFEPDSTEYIETMVRIIEYLKAKR